MTKIESLILAPKTRFGDLAQGVSAYSRGASAAPALLGMYPALQPALPPLRKRLQGKGGSNRYAPSEFSAGAR